MASQKKKKYIYIIYFFLFLVSQGIPGFYPWTNSSRYCWVPRWGSLPRKFATSTRAWNWDHLHKWLEPLPLRPTFVGILFRLYIIYKFNNHGRMQCASHISIGLILCINISITSSSSFTLSLIQALSIAFIILIVVVLIFYWVCNHYKFSN